MSKLSKILGIATGIGAMALAGHLIHKDNQMLRETQELIRRANIVNIYSARFSHQDILDAYHSEHTQLHLGIHQYLRQVAEDNPNLRLPIDGPTDGKVALAGYQYNGN